MTRAQFTVLLGLAVYLLRLRGDNYLEGLRRGY